MIPESVPVDLVIDHSVQVDVSRSENALQANMELELKRNKERCSFLKRGANAFNNMLVIPPGSRCRDCSSGESRIPCVLARVVFNTNGILYPDSVFGTDSHTSMVDGLGVAGWGVGGIEAEAAMLGQAISMVLPGVVGFKLSGSLKNGVTATDLVLTVAKMLRKHGVVGNFVEFYGEGMCEIALPDRATIANMSPEYGATMGFFPVDHVTLQYLKLTGRSDDMISMIESYLQANKLFMDYSKPEREMVFSSHLKLNLEDVEPCVAGPKRPHDQVLLKDMKGDWHACLDSKVGFKGYGIKKEDQKKIVEFEFGGMPAQLKHGDIVEGRIHPLTRANYLASPPLVVAYALAGTVHIDFETQPIGSSKDGKEIYLRDIWPSSEEVAGIVQCNVLPDMFKSVYETITEGHPTWDDLHAPSTRLYEWDPQSSYIREPPNLKNISVTPPGPYAVKDAYCLLNLGDSITTDHISPGGSIHKDSPAAKYLTELGVNRRDFNSYGSRRGNDEVMVGGTFCNIRLVNKLLEGEVGPNTVHIPSGEKLSVFDAAMRYIREGQDTIILAGAEYGTGSARDWAAKVMGVKAVIAKSFERIHRSNLAGMGIIPLCFQPDEDVETLELTGHERYTIDLPNDISKIKPGQEVIVKTDNGKSFKCKLRFDTEVELAYFNHGDILQYVIRSFIGSKKGNKNFTT